MEHRDTRILTQHPAGKQGVNIDRAKYDTIKHAIKECLSKNGPTTFGKLGDDVSAAVGADFEGSIGWYYTTVKLDLEARGIIARVPGSQPQLVHLADAPAREEQS